MICLKGYRSDILVEASELKLGCVKSDERMFEREKQQQKLGAFER